MLLVATLMLGTATVRVPGATAQSSRVRGTATDTRGVAVAGALVTLDDTTSIATDSAGAYAFELRTPGVHVLRFSALGYRPFTVTIRVGTGASPVVDVVLVAKVFALSTVHVSVSRSHPTASTAVSDTAPTLGSWRLDASALREAPRLARPDALQALAGSPSVRMQPEMPTTLHVRGGASDESSVLLDGFPIDNLLHSAGAASVIDPSAVSSVELEGAVPSARFGGGLSGIVRVSTLDAPTSATLASGMLTPGIASALVGLPFSMVHGGVFASLRRGYANLLPRIGGINANDPGTIPAWSDVLVKSVARVGGSTISGLAFATHDRFLFDALATPDAQGASSSTPEGDAPAASPTAAPVSSDVTTSVGDGPQNRFDWSASLAGVSWQHPIARGDASMRLWRSATHVGASWATTRGPVRLLSTLVRTGAEATTTWTSPSARTTAGVRVERMSTVYDVAGSAAASGTTLPDSAPLLRLAASPLIITPFAEREWHLPHRVTIVSGLRAPTLNGTTPRIEPHLLTSILLRPGLQLSLGYARSHQYAQSLRNEESIVDASAGVALPVAVTPGGVPVASADAIVGTLDVPLSPRDRLTFEAYSQWLHDVVLVAPVTGEAFATAGFTTGRGRASGVNVSVAHSSSRWSWDAIGSLSSVTRSAGGATYRPAFAPRVSGSGTMTYRASGRTRLGMAIWGVAGRTTTAVSDTLAWSWAHTLLSQRVISGTPHRYAGRLGSTELPTYVRVDLTARHDVPFGRSRVATLFGGIQNILDARNAYGISRSVAGVQQPLEMMPRSLVVGIEWR